MASNYSYTLKGFSQFYNDMTHHLFSSSTLSTLYLNEINQLMQSSTSMTIVEMAAGSGRIVKQLAHHLKDWAHEVHFVLCDHSQEMLDAAKDNLAECMRHPRHGFAFYQQSMDMPLLQVDSVADVVILGAGSIMHLLDYRSMDACMDAMYKVVRPGGCVIVDIMHTDMITGDMTLSMHVPARLDGGHWIRTRVDRSVKDGMVKDTFQLSKFDHNGHKQWEATEGWSLRLTTPKELLECVHAQGWMDAKEYYDQQPTPADTYRFYSIVARRPSMAPILVTGGCGYIGSHTVVELLQHGHDVVIVDNLSNSTSKVLDRIHHVTGKQARFYQVDLLNVDALTRVFHQHRPSAVIHFAGLKSVAESGKMPLTYYHTNIQGTHHLVQAMLSCGCHQLVFSSSATVYGDPIKTPIPETSRLFTTNPYGQTKLMIEGMLEDVHIAFPHFRVLVLRYFNPAGAHPSGHIGEDPRGVIYNLMPLIARAAAGKHEMQVCGDHYPTRDGTCIRDYVHVVDLAQGHLAALHHLQQSTQVGYKAYNLGTGRGMTVLEMIQAMSKAVGKDIPYVIGAPRAGDVKDLTADPSLAERELGWKAKMDLDTICMDLWRFQQANPNGYD